MVSKESKLNLSLDEISYIKTLENDNKKLKEENDGFKKDNKKLKDTNKGLQNSLNSIINDYYSLKENLEVLEMEDWIIHRTYNNNEYVSGYLISEKKMWDTSNILSKTATKYGLIVVTISEHIYYLPYSESYVNY